MNRKVLLWLLTPVWILLALLAVALILLWTTLWFLFDNFHRTSALAVTLLAALLVAVGVTTPSPWSPWQESVMDCSVIAAASCTVVWGLQTAERIPQALSYAALVTASAYVVAKASYVSTGAAQPGGAPLALLVVAAVFPLIQAAAIARLWRGANAEACALVAREILSEFVSARFSQRIVAGLHTVEFEQPRQVGGGGGGLKGFQQESSGSASDASADAATAVPVVFLHGYAAGSAYFAFNFDSAVSVAGTRVFAVDWRGCAGSTRERFTPRSTAEAEHWFIESLDRWRAAQGFSRMILVGHSLGGYLSAVYTTLHPGRVAGLVLVSPVGVGGDGKPELPGHRSPSPSSPRGAGAAPPPVRGPPRIPAWVLPLVSALWNGGVTPGVMVRALGPLGLWFSRRAAVTRVSRMTLEIPMSPKQLSVLGTYFWHSTAADGSGEHALRHLLGPGAFAYKPIGARLVAAAQRPVGDALRLRCRVLFIYGATHDWMQSRHGCEVAQQLVAAGVPSHVQLCGPAGHHVYLEAPSRFNAALRAELAAILHGDTSVPPPPPDEEGGSADPSDVAINSGAI